MPVPKAAIFDVFGTVVDWRTGIATEAGRAFIAKGLKHDPARFADLWRAEYQPAMARIREGNRGYVPLDDLHLENLTTVLHAEGLDKHFSADERRALNHAWEKLPPWADSVAGLSALRRHMIIAPCSNGSIALMTRLARYGGLPWDCILGAEIAQNYKPHPSVYQASCKALGFRPDEVVMVACHNDDLAAAREAGLMTAYLPRPDENGPGGTAAPNADWDFVLENLMGLSGALT
ncbi:MAG: haloacid dehalogenase type II [Pikeienuella sp.]